jgi:transglutaminase-like putative cysteine protease
MTIFSVRHVTQYTYKRPVAFGQHRVLFRPRDSFDQRLLDATMVIVPKPAQVRWIHDFFGNCIALVDMAGPSDHLRFETNIRLDHTPEVPIHFEMDSEALTYPFSYDEEELPDLRCSIARYYDDPDGEVEHWARQFVGPGASGQTGHILMTLCFSIRQSFALCAPGRARHADAGADAAAPARHLSRLRAADDGGGPLAGLCRPFRHRLYLCARPRRIETLGGGSTHAWCQVYLPGAGWVEFDPTNGIVGNRDLIRVGVARDPRQAIPLWGSYDGDAADFDDMIVQVNVTTEP